MTLPAGVAGPGAWLGRARAYRVRAGSLPITPVHTASDGDFKTSIPVDIDPNECSSGRGGCWDSDQQPGIDPSCLQLPAGGGRDRDPASWAPACFRSRLSAASAARQTAARRDCPHLHLPALRAQILRLPEPVEIHRCDVIALAIAGLAKGSDSILDAAMAASKCVCSGSA